MNPIQDAPVLSGANDLTAIDEDTAEEALSKIKVDYEVLPAVLSTEEAMKPGESGKEK